MGKKKKKMISRACFKKLLLISISLGLTSKSKLPNIYKNKTNKQKKTDKGREWLADEPVLVLLYVYQFPTFEL